MRIIAAILVLVLMPADARACQCPTGNLTPEQAFNQATLVFTAKAQEVRGGFYFPGVGGTVFEPIEVFKGFPKSVKLYDIAYVEGENSCDVTFWKDKEYLIYAEQYDFYFRATICSRTNLLSAVDEEELEALREFAKPYYGIEKGLQQGLDEMMKLKPR